jgi:hypothetical protein
MLVFGTTVIAMLGPGLALRGQGGSMHTAVDGMLLEFNVVSRLFHVLIYFFLLSALALSWSGYSPSWQISVMLTVVLGAIGALVAHRRLTLEAHFPLASVPLTSGAFLTASARGAQPASGSRRSGAAPRAPSSGGGSDGRPSLYRQPSEPAASRGSSGGGGGKAAATSPNLY